MKRLYQRGAVGELLEVERRGDAERHRHDGRGEHQPDRAEDAGPESGALREERRVVLA